MLEIFRKNRFFNSILLLPYTILVRVWSAFGGESPSFEIKGVLADWLIGSVEDQSALAIILSIMLVYVQAIMLNRMVIRNRINAEMTLFPGLFYILLVSFFPMYNGLSTPLLANTFIILGLEQLMSTHKKVGSAARIFTAAFWLSSAFLCYFGYAPMFLFGLLGLSVLRTVKMTEWMQYLLGYIAPLLIIAMLDYLMYDTLEHFAGHFSRYFGFLDFRFSLGPPLYGQIGLFAFLTGLSIFHYNNFTMRTNIQVQKRINMLYWSLFFMLTLIFIQKGIYYEEWITISLPLAVFTAMIFANSKQILLLEIVHFVILIAVLAMQITVLL